MRPDFFWSQLGGGDLDKFASKKGEDRFSLLVGFFLLVGRGGLDKFGGSVPAGGGVGGLKQIRVQKGPKGEPCLFFHVL